MKQGIWYDYLMKFRNKPVYSLLSTKPLLLIPKRLSDGISALQQSFIMENKNRQFKKQSATIEDVNSFYIFDSDIDDQWSSHFK